MGRTFRHATGVVLAFICAASYVGNAWAEPGSETMVVADATDVSPLSAMPSVEHITADKDAIDNSVQQLLKQRLDPPADGGAIRHPAAIPATPAPRWMPPAMNQPTDISGNVQRLYNEKLSPTANTVPPAPLPANLQPYNYRPPRETPTSVVQLDDKANIQSNVMAMFNQHLTPVAAPQPQLPPSQFVQAPKRPFIADLSPDAALLAASPPETPKAEMPAPALPAVTTPIQPVMAAVSPLRSEVVTPALPPSVPPADVAIAAPPPATSYLAPPAPRPASPAPVVAPVEPQRDYALMAQPVAPPPVLPYEAPVAPINRPQASAAVAPLVQPSLPPKIMDSDPNIAALTGEPRSTDPSNANFEHVWAMQLQALEQENQALRQKAQLLGADPLRDIRVDAVAQIHEEVLRQRISELEHEVDKRSMKDSDELPQKTSDDHVSAAAKKAAAAAIAPPKAPADKPASN